jgi:hypothetical protein
MRRLVASLLLVTACSTTNNVTNIYEGAPDASDGGADVTAEARGDVATSDVASSDGAADVEAVQDGANDAEAGPPACTGVDPSLINAAIACAEQDCSTTPPGDSSGRLAGDAGTGGDCLSANCPAQFLNLQAATPNGVACFHCIVDTLVSGQTFQATLSTCAP